MNYLLNYLYTGVLFRAIRVNLWMIGKIRQVNQILDRRLQACLDWD